MSISMKDRPIAMTDLETSGDIFTAHEILEIGLVLFDQQTLRIMDMQSAKVRPEHIENAVPAALERNGYNPADWQDAVSLRDAMREYGRKTEGAIFCAYNVSFDWGFVQEAFRRTGVRNRMDYHSLDMLSIAWARGLKNLDRWNMNSACEHFALPHEPKIHRAINGAMTAYELWKKLEAPEPAAKISPAAI